MQTVRLKKSALADCSSRGWPWWRPCLEELWKKRPCLGYMWSYCEATECALSLFSRSPLPNTPLIAFPTGGPSFVPLCRTSRHFRESPNIWHVLCFVFTLYHFSKNRGPVRFYSISIHC
jgi:hypothetical protein